ncbi:uncharacterized protein BJ171DRAFT_579709 [Polychytrium aggregatum]|uniref:uncharacterized protein n=1 Tax=Polychytrium aggregatum TaxID=110093 RepID=UPI0022FEA44A|nr:uncharacterized protein BJ171DRAFT_579709 [Polychytrium aggregatum]KAI9206742.1 hypothetical protein BJ171DRAFT_579709 [Polychytrium aggregatum]
MLQEVTAAANHLCKYLLLGKSASTLSNESIVLFNKALVSLLIQKFKGHWDPNFPMRGNAYRSISVFNGVPDPLIEEAAHHASIPNIECFFPQELVLWIDPRCVSYRTGDFGPVVNIWEREELPPTTSELMASVPVVSSAAPTSTPLTVTSPVFTPKYHPSAKVTPPSPPKYTTYRSKAVPITYPGQSPNLAYHPSAVPHSYYRPSQSTYSRGVFAN